MLYCNQILALACWSSHYDSTKADISSIKPKLASIIYLAGTE